MASSANKINLLVVSHAAVLAVNRALFQALARREKVRVSMIVPNSWRGDLISDLKFTAVTADASLQVRPVPTCLSGNGSFFFFTRNLQKLIKSAAPDLIFIDEEPWSLACAQIIAAAPAETKVGIYTKQNLPKPVPWPFSWLQKRALRRADLCFSVESEVAEVLRWKGYAGPIVSLPHSFDAGLFSPERELAKKRKARNLPLDRLIFFYAGRLTLEKGVIDFLDAIELFWKNSAKENPEAREPFFWIMGNGPLRAELQKRTANWPKSKFRLDSAEMHERFGEALALADVLVLPSRTTARWKEQFGRVLVEAMACRVACLGSSSGAIPRLISAAGAGISFVEGNIADFSAAIARLAADPEKVAIYKAQGAEYANRTFTHEAVAEALEREILQISLDQHSRH